MRHSEYYERAVDGPDVGDSWLGERRLGNLYAPSEVYVSPQHTHAVFQVCIHVDVVGFS